MSDGTVRLPDCPQVVLIDANVLYARVLRDYLLHAASTGVISIAWSETILNEAVGHMAESVPGFTAESGDLLKLLMNEAYPLAQVNPTTNDYSRLNDVAMPDEGDRHVMAAALAVDADIICTANIKDFPSYIASPFDIKILTPDELLVALIEKHPEKLLVAHQRTIARLRRATDASTLDALRKAGASKAADAMVCLL